MSLLDEKYDYLAHYGVKGMAWGVRKRQEERVKTAQNKAKRDRQERAKAEAAAKGEGEKTNYIVDSNGKRILAPPAATPPPSESSETEEEKTEEEKEEKKGKGGGGKSKSEKDKKEKEKKDAAKEKVKDERAKKAASGLTASAKKNQKKIADLEKKVRDMEKIMADNKRRSEREAMVRKLLEGDISSSVVDSREAAYKGAPSVGVLGELLKT